MFFKKTFSILAITFLLIIHPFIALATTTTTTSSTNAFLDGYVCEPNNSAIGSGSNVGTCINNIYVFAVGFIGFMSVLIVVFAGYLYMTGGSENITKAKGYLGAVFAALIIIFGTYLILNTINPNLTNVNGVIVPNINCGATVSGSLNTTRDAINSGTPNPGQCALANLGISQNATIGTNNGSQAVTNGVILDGFNLSSYSTNPNYLTNVTKIFNSIQSANLQSAADINSYIQKHSSNSPITGQMVLNTSNNYGTDTSILLTIMQEESSFGTQGKGANTFNPGNVGNDDAGNIKNWGT